jgi:hypothetical protein
VNSGMPIVYIIKERNTILVSTSRRSVMFKIIIIPLSLLNIRM